MGKRDEYKHRLAQNLVPLVLRHELDGAAVVQTVGEFDENNAHVVVECEEYALEILGLYALGLGLILIVEHSLDFRESFYKRGYFVAEEVSDVF